MRCRMSIGPISDYDTYKLSNGPWENKPDDDELLAEYADERREEEDDTENRK